MLASIWPLDFDDEPEPDMCDCPASEMEEHTERQHDKESCNRNPHCGGCWDCICMQIAHGQRMERDREEATRRQAEALLGLFMDPSTGLADILKKSVQGSDSTPASVS